MIKEYTYEIHTYINWGVSSLKEGLHEWWTISWSFVHYLRRSTLNIYHTMLQVPLSVCHTSSPQNFAKTGVLILRMSSRQEMEYLLNICFWELKLHGGMIEFFHHYMPGFHIYTQTGTLWWVETNLYQCGASIVLLNFTPLSS